MPVYDYKCKECKTSTTKFCDMDERHEQRCDCGSALELQISAPHVIGANSGDRYGDE